MNLIMVRFKFFLRFLGMALANFLVFTTFLVPLPSNGSPSSYRLFNPFGALHNLPVGEQPGWSSRVWMDFELSQGNVWNMPIHLVNLTNNMALEYQADLGQTAYILEMGLALSKRWALSLEVPHFTRSGGFLDHLIDQFHVIIGNDRFNRQLFDENLSKYSVKVDGQELLSPLPESGLGNVKLKLKYWMFQWKGRQKGSCECGLAFSTQVKVPTAPLKSGLTSNNTDYSFLAHLGVPLFSASGLWLTAAGTHTKENELLKDWPRRIWHQMYEISTDFSMNKSWGIVFQTRVESPYLEKRDVLVTDITTEEELKNVASAWNTLFHWRGTEALGVRYRTRNGSQFSFLMVEDWAPGQFDKDDPEDSFYINNAPDLMFLFKSYIAF